MMNWFLAGGFGMFVVLAIGAGGIGFGAKAVGTPTASRLATLRSMPALIAAASIFAFGTNLWAVNRFLTDEVLAKSPWIGIVGITEAAQPLTLGGLLAMVVVVLRMVAEAKSARVGAG